MGKVNIMVNRKVKNATVTTYDGTEFASKLEVTCYKKLKEAGFIFKYEPIKFTLVEGFVLTGGYYLAPQLQRRSKQEKEDRVKKVRLFKEVTRKQLDTTYTPDFIVENEFIDIYIDVKGMSNDIYPLKRKMFLKFLEQESIKKEKPYIFFEPHSVKEIDVTVGIINEINTKHGYNSTNKE